MTRRIRPIGDSDLAPLSAFLRERFGTSSELRFADAGTLKWKYLDTGPLWEGPRAFVVEDDATIVACAGIAPAVFTTPDGARVATLTVIDWAADPAAPGVGIAIFTHVVRLAGTAFHVGGAPATRSIVPRLGFAPVPDVPVWACWFRPWREFAGREKSFRAVLRLGHGLLHRSPRSGAVRGAWQSVRVEKFDARVEPTLDRRDPAQITFLRTTASLNHMLACPVVRMEGHLLTEHERVRGYFVLAFSEWEARVVDLNIESGTLDDWRAAYATVSDVARASVNVCRLRAMAAASVRREALEREHFWITKREPVLVFDRAKTLPAMPHDLQFFESDLAYT